jgi:hypothetical protein
MRADGLKGLGELFVHGHNEGRAFKGDQKVVENLLNRMRPPPGGKFFQVGEVGRVGNEMAGSNMIGMSPSPPRLYIIVGRQDDLGPILADKRGNLLPVPKTILQAGIPEVEGLEGIHLKECGRCLRLLPPEFPGPGPHIPLGETDDPSPIPSGLHLQEESPGPDLGIIGMCPKGQKI